MRTIPFCSENLVKIKKEAKEIHWLLTENKFIVDKKTDFTVGDFLNAFALSNGYTSWGGMIAKNKQRRSYVQFSFTKYFHMEFYAEDIASQIAVPKKYLMISSSLMSLGVAADKNNILLNLNDDPKILNHNITLAIEKMPDDCNYQWWVTSLQSLPNSLLEFGLAAPLKTFFLIMPELVQFLKKICGSKDEQLIAHPFLLDEILDDGEHSCDGYLKIFYENRVIYSLLDFVEDPPSPDERLEYFYKLYYEISEILGFKILDTEDKDNDYNILILDKFIHSGIKLEMCLFNKIKEYQDYEQYIPMRIISLNDDTLRRLIEIRKKEGWIATNLLEFRGRLREPWLDSDWFYKKDYFRNIVDRSRQNKMVQL